MFDVNSIIQSGGILFVAFVIFAESGLLIGFWLPGDTLLLGAGIIAAQGEISLLWLIFAIVAAAILGDNVGYSIGRRTGHKIFKKDDGIFFQKEHVIRAEKFYEDHGGKTIILARFIPIVRTFAPLVAGVGKMKRQRFMLFNVIGALLWGAGVTLIGYWFGSKIPHLEEYVHYVILGVVLISILSSLIHILKEKKIRDRLFAKVKRLLRLFTLNKKV
ncbi:VTT domain-containing protein [Candidatus Saccharibacteria bacterium]|nr:VTT domain-containing protein [Candidatus Saccharibacteria bacterium]